MDPKVPAAAAQSEWAATQQSSQDEQLSLAHSRPAAQARKMRKMLLRCASCQMTISKVGS